MSRPVPISSLDPALRARIKKSSRLQEPRIRRADARNDFAGVTLVVPIEHCVSDNAKYIVMRGYRRLVLSPEYRAAKEAVQQIARRAMRDQKPASALVELKAEVRFANNRRDLQNASKLLCDAMQGIVYEDDKLIQRATWTRGPNDKDRPHVRLTLTPAEHPYP